MKPFVRRVLFPALLIAGVSASGAGKKSHPSASASASPRRLEIPIMIDHDADGIDFGTLDDFGRKAYHFKIGKAHRPDADHIDMTNAFMQTFDTKGDPDISVYMTKAVLDENTRIVTSDVPVLISRSDFRIVGQKLVFDTAARKGVLSGHVHTLFYDLDKSAASAASPSPSAQPSAQPSPSPKSQ